MTDADPTAREPDLTSAEVKTRAARGVALLLGRGIAFQIVGFLGNLVLARLLVPADFGLVALGLTIVNVGRFLAVGGLGYALVGRAEPPTRAELRGLTGLQLVITTAIGGSVALVAIIVGGDALVTALMMLALPMAAIKSPALLLLQRQMRFKEQVQVEATEVVTNLAAAIPLAAAGLGAWSLATSTVVAALASTVTACAVSPAGFVRPSGSFARIRSLLAFGLRYQATSASHLAGDVALIAGIGAIGGLTALGLWNFASRILRLPYLLFEAMWNVGFPAFARLLESSDHEEVGRLLERSVGTFAVVVAAVLAPLVASSPALIPVLFGDVWSDVSYILPGSALALGVYGPIGISAYGYLYARGDARTGFIGSLVGNALRLSVTFALLPSIGVWAIGIGWAAGALGEMPIVVVQVRRVSGAHLLRQVLKPSIIACVTTAAGWAVAVELGNTAASAALAILIALGGFLLLIRILGQTEFEAALAMLRRAATAARGRPQTA